MSKPENTLWTGLPYVQVPHPFSSLVFQVGSCPVLYNISVHLRYCKGHYLRAYLLYACIRSVKVTVTLDASRESEGAVNTAQLHTTQSTGPCSSVQLAAWGFNCNRGRQFVRWRKGNILGRPTHFNTKVHLYVFRIVLTVKYFIWNRATVFYYFLDRLSFNKHLSKRKYICCFKWLTPCRVFLDS
jgi:hypothetical protein